MKNCPNCGKEIYSDHYNQNDDLGGDDDNLNPIEISWGRYICQCGEGCYEWEDDNTIGCKEQSKGKCCKCKK
jgi:hypothetical protein